MSTSPIQHPPCTLLAALHVQVRLAIVVLLTVVVALCGQMQALAAAAPIAGALLWAGWPGGGVVMRGLFVVNTFILFLWLIVPFSGSGTVLMFIGPLAVHAEGLKLVIATTVRANEILCIMLGCIAGLPMHAVVKGMEAFYVPKSLCAMLFFSMRYIHGIQYMYQRLETAATLRCFTPGMNRHTWRTVGHMFAMTLVRSLEQAQRVHQAMQLRGYDGSFRSLPLVPWRKRDVAALAAALCSVLFIVALEFKVLEVGGV